MGHFQLQMSQNVAPLTNIVALFGEKTWGAFWRLLAQKRAVSDSELLNTLPLMNTLVYVNIDQGILKGKMKVA